MKRVELRLPETQHAVEDRSQAIRDRLRDAIVDRRLAPGAKLAESEVGALFAVSRTVAHAALQMLAFEGLVRFERNRGAFVANPSPEEARQVFAARRLVEPGIVAAAVERKTPSGIARLKAHLASERRHMSERGPRARRAEIKASGELHLLIAAMSGNVVLLRFMEELVARSSLVIALYGKSGASSCGHDEHAAIVEALKSGDSEAAQALMLRHIGHIEADLELRAGATLALKDALEL